MSKKNTQTTDGFKEKQRLLAKYVVELKSKATYSEQIFIHRLREHGIKFMFQKGFIGGEGFCIADFYIPMYGLVIEIDGSAHDTDRQQVRDYYKDIYYKSRGLKVLRIKNEDVRTFSFDYFKSLSKHTGFQPKPIIKSVKKKEKTEQANATTYQEYKYKKIIKEKIAKKKEYNLKLDKLREKYQDEIRTKPQDIKKWRVQRSDNGKRIGEKERRKRLAERYPIIEPLKLRNE